MPCLAELGLGIPLMEILFRQAAEQIVHPSSPQPHALYRKKDRMYFVASSA